MLGFLPMAYEYLIINFLPPLVQIFGTFQYNINSVEETNLLN